MKDAVMIRIRGGQTVVLSNDNAEKIFKKLGINSIYDAEYFNSMEIIETKVIDDKDFVNVCEPGKDMEYNRFVATLSKYAKEAISDNEE